MPTATTTRPITYSLMLSRQPIFATTVTMAKLRRAIQKTDIQNAAITIGVLRYLLQLGMVQVNATRKGKDWMKRCHFTMYFSNPHLVLKRSGLGGAATMAGRHGSNFMAGSSSSKSPGASSLSSALCDSSSGTVGSPGSCDRVCRWCWKCPCS